MWRERAENGREGKLARRLKLERKAKTRGAETRREGNLARRPKLKEERTNTRRGDLGFNGKTNAR